MKKPMNLTIAPEIRIIAEAIAKRRRRSLSELFEDFVLEEDGRQTDSRLNVREDSQKVLHIHSAAPAQQGTTYPKKKKAK